MIIKEYIQPSTDITKGYASAGLYKYFTTFEINIYNNIHCTFLDIKKMVI